MSAREKAQIELNRQERISMNAKFLFCSNLKGVANPIELSGTKLVGDHLEVPVYLRPGKNVLFQPPFSDLFEDDDLLPLSLFTPPKGFSFPQDVTDGFERETVQLSEQNWSIFKLAELYTTLLIRPRWIVSNASAQKPGFVHSLSPDEAAHMESMNQLAETNKTEIIEYLLNDHLFLFKRIFNKPTAELARMRIDKLMQKVNTKLSLFHANWQGYFSRTGSTLDNLGNIIKFAIPSFVHYCSTATDTRLAGMKVEVPEMFDLVEVGNLTQADFARTVGIAGKKDLNQKHRIHKSGLLT